MLSSYFSEFFLLWYNAFPASSPRYVKRHFEALPEYIVPLHCRAAMHTLPDPAGFDPVYPFFSAVQTAIYATRLE